MAMYSLELRQIIENGINIFNFDYDFYDFKKKSEFERDFIRHFYFREIGVETIDKFRWFLEDKMKLVFPYYNELLKTAEIEYNILDNYNVKEEYTIKRENKGKTSGVFSSRGRVSDEHSTEDTSEQNREHQNGVDETINNTTSGNETENGEYTKNVSNETNVNEKIDKRFLDTPQGKLNLETTDYLTTMNLDQTERSETSETEEAGTNQNTRENNGQNDTVRNVEDSGSEKVTGSANSSFTGEQRTTHDNNTRSETLNEQTETYEHIKKGNIGVDTDSDMIQKHIKLQKTLMRIKTMFFDECEDLFMQVF